MLFCRVQPVMSEKELLLSGKSFTRKKNKAETLLQDFSR